MASLQRLDMEKLRTRRIVATASLTAIAAASLLVMCRSTAVGPTRPAAAPSHETVAQAPAEIQRELAVLYLPDFQISDPIPTPAAHPEPSPAPQQMGPPEPQDSSPAASEQRLFRSRRALETMDPREFLRHGR